MCVCLSVSLLITFANCAKTAELIEILFPAWTRCGPKGRVLYGGPGPNGERGNLRVILGC